MPTIPMFIPPTVPDAWHQVSAPGGYEWWYFDAEQTDGDLRIVIILFQGFVFHPGYLRQYAKFLPPADRSPPRPGRRIFRARISSSTAAIKSSRSS